MSRFRIACHLILFGNVPQEGRRDFVLEEAFDAVARASLTTSTGRPQTSCARPAGERWSWV